MAKFEQAGTISHLYPVEHVGQQGTPKQCFLLSYNDGPNGEYPQVIKCEVFKKVDILQGVQPGTEVIAHFDLRGRGYVNRKDGQPDAFNTLQCWKIQAMVAAPPQTHYPAPSAPNMPAPPYAAPQQGGYVPPPPAPAGAPMQADGQPPF